MPEQKAHILIIDDNEDILTMLKTMLSLKGYFVSVINNAVNIEVELIKLSPCMILMDMLLSGADGRDVCRKLKASESFALIPIVMISARPNAKEECLAAGADNFLEKPFDMQELYKIVEETLNGK